jgi:branched-chain amino acid transport system permease protein
MEYLGQLLVDTVLLGGLYTLMVIGLSLSFGVTRVINFAHGEAIMLGAYGAYWAMTLLNVDPLIAMPVLMLLGWVAGYVIFRMVFARVIGAPAENQILLTFGLGLILQNMALMLWTGDQRSSNPPYVFASFQLGDSTVVAVGRLIGCGAAVILVGALFLWLKYAETGRASRALAENGEAAALMGINIRQTYAVAFGIGTALGVATGAIMSSLSAITPFMGFNMLVKSFAIIVLGGMGSVLGSVAGAFLLAFAETAVSYYVPNGDGWAEGVAFAVLFCVLVLRPRGIAGQAVAE